MANQPANHGQHWSSQEVRQLQQLASQSTPPRVMGLKLGRTEDLLLAKASEEGCSLKPTNQSPYNRRSG